MVAMAPPGSFSPAHIVDLAINFGDATDDYRRVRAEHWCWLRAQGRWLRRIPLNTGIARFEFELGRDAVLFKLHHI